MSVSPIQKRFLLFLLLCIPARLVITAVAKYMPLKYLPILGAIFIIIGVSFFTLIYLINV